MTVDTSGLFAPLALRNLTVPNRFAMAPMTRQASPGGIPGPDVAEYYARRAAGGVGLIITEGVRLGDPSAAGSQDIPTLVGAAALDGWRNVTSAVHRHGSTIAAQLWHQGAERGDRDGVAPVSPSGVNGLGEQVGRALEADELPVVAQWYAEAARNAKDVGFDAVELHGAHGYLLDQFLWTRTNLRTDEYGGSVENRCRFMLELVEAVTRAVPANKVMARISPSRFMGGLYEWPDLDEMIAHLAPALSQLGLGALDVSCANSDYFQTSGRMVRKIRPYFPGVIVSGASLTQEQAEAELESGFVDAITWGRAFIANPDLAQRMQDGAELVPFDDSMRSTLV